MMAFASLVGDTLAAAQQFPKGGLHHAARAKHVIFLFMNGGLSQVDSFDPKPMLDKYHGQPLPGGEIKTERKTGAAFPSPFKFQKYGQSGVEVSELFPNVAKSIDDICVIRSMQAELPNHEPSCLMVYGPGRYRFTDFLKVGSLLTLLIGIIALVMVPRIWPLR